MTQTQSGLNFSVLSQSAVSKKRSLGEAQQESRSIKQDFPNDGEKRIPIFTTNVIEEDELPALPSTPVITEVKETDDLASILEVSEEKAMSLYATPSVSISGGYFKAKEKMQTQQNSQILRLKDNLS